jgi:hypothetical protein
LPAFVYERLAHIEDHGIYQVNSRISGGPWSKSL